MDEQFDLRPLLDYIDPASCSYAEWAQVGMALKHEGYSVSDWDQWSQRDGDRYHAGECERKWRTFKEAAGSVVTGATITQMAKNAGWQPASHDDEILDWDSALEVDDLDRGYRLIDTDYIKGTKLQEPKNWNPVDQIKRFVQALYKPEDYINYVTQAYPKEEKKRHHEMGTVRQWGIHPDCGGLTKSPGQL